MLSWITRTELNDKSYRDIATQLHDPGNNHSHPLANQPGTKNRKHRSPAQSTTEALYLTPNAHLLMLHPDPYHPALTTSSRRMHNLEPLRHQLRDILILMLQQPQGKRDIVPLALGITPGQPCGELLSQLFRVLVLCQPSQSASI